MTTKASTSKATLTLTKRPRDEGIKLPPKKMHKITKESVVLVQPMPTEPSKTKKPELVAVTIPFDPVPATQDFYNTLTDEDFAELNMNMDGFEEAAKKKVGLKELSDEVVKEIRRILTFIHKEVPLRRIEEEITTITDEIKMVECMLTFKPSGDKFQIASMLRELASDFELKSGTVAFSTRFEAISRLLKENKVKVENSIREYKIEKESLKLKHTRLRIQMIELIQQASEVLEIPEEEAEMFIDVLAQTRIGNYECFKAKIDLVGKMFPKHQAAKEKLEKNEISPGTLFDNYEVFTKDVNECISKFEKLKSLVSERKRAQRDYSIVVDRWRFLMNMVGGANVGDTLVKDN